MLYFNGVKIYLPIFSPICQFFPIFSDFSRFLPIFRDVRFFLAEKSAARKNRDFSGHRRKIGDFFHYALNHCSLCGKGFLMFFPKAQPLQWLCFSSCTWGTPMTACLKCLSAPWCKCAILLCHNSPWLLSLLTRAFVGSKCSLHSFTLMIPITRSKL